MIELVIDSFGDTYINADKTSENYGSGAWVQVKSGSLIALLKPHLGNIAGRTVLDAYLVGHAAKATVAQTLTVKAVTEKWVPNRVNFKRRPSATGTNSVSEAIGVLAVGDAFTIPGLGPLLQTIADGTDWHGLELTTSATSQQAFQAAGYGEPAWELHVMLSDAADQPTNLRPDGGAVSSTSPVCAWDFTDGGEGDANEQAWSQVQVDTPAVGVEPDDVAPDYDSGWQANPDPQWSLNVPAPRTVSVTTTNLSTTVTSAGLFKSTDVGATISGTGIPAGATITGFTSTSSVTISAAATASGTVTATLTTATRHTVVGAGPHFWRVRVADADGITNASDWSDWAEFTVTTDLAIVVDSPTGPFGDPTPEILAHITGGTLTAWKAKVTGPDRSDVRARTGLITQAGGTIAWTVPFREEKLDTGGPDGAYWTETRRVLRDDRPAWLNIKAWDEKSRAVAVGEKGYADIWVPLTFDDDLTIATPGNFTLTQQAPGDPRHAWSWTHTEAATVYVVRVDGQTVARLTLDELTVDAGVYTWPNDLGVIPPLGLHTLSVHAVENGQRSAAAELPYSYTAEGFWIIPAADIDPIVLDGTDVDDWLREDYVATYTTSTGDLVDISYGQPGLAATFGGSVDNRDGDAELWATLERIKELRKSRNRLARIVWGSRAITSRVRSIDATPAGRILPTDLTHNVSVSIVQLDED